MRNWRKQYVELYWAQSNSVFHATCISSVCSTENEYVGLYTACDPASPFPAVSNRRQVFRPLTRNTLSSTGVAESLYSSGGCPATFVYLSTPNKMLFLPRKFIGPKLFASVLISQGRWTFSVPIGREVHLFQFNQ